MAQYLISDLHLDHENIIEYCSRPFEDVEEMNEVLVKNWNVTVDPDDEVIFGGDLTIALETPRWGESQVAPAIRGSLLTKESTNTN